MHYCVVRVKSRWHFVRASADLDGGLVQGSGARNQPEHQLRCKCGCHGHVRLRQQWRGNPSAQNKTTVSGPVTASGTFSSGKNGQVTESLTLSPPSAGGFSCPPGQDLEIAQVVYTNVAITDTTNGITEPIPGTFDTGCLLPNVRGAC
jgi:hypothetical protein